MLLYDILIFDTCSIFWPALHCAPFIYIYVDYLPHSAQTHLKGREPKDHSRELVLDEHEVSCLSNTHFLSPLEMGCLSNITSFLSPLEL